MKIKVKELKTFKERLFGLIGADKPIPVIFKTRFGIHTFGLQFPIDVLIIDHHNKIIKPVSSINKNSILFWNPKYDTVIELPRGFIIKNKLKKGDKIQLIFE